MVIASVGAASSQSDGAATVLMSVMVGMVVFAGLIVLCSGVYWMAAFDKEKRALHDRISGTGSLRNNQERWKPTPEKLKPPCSVRPAGTNSAWSNSRIVFPRIAQCVAVRSGLRFSLVFIRILRNRSTRRSHLKTKRVCSFYSELKRKRCATSAVASCRKKHRLSGVTRITVFPVSIGFEKRKRTLRSSLEPGSTIIVLLPW